MSRTERQYAQVALPVGLRRVFTYAVPPALREVLRVGHRVRVPFGPRRHAYGYVVDFTSERPSFALKKIIAPEPDEIVFTPEILSLTRWIADYYLAPWGQVLEAALPPSVRRGRPPSRRPLEVPLPAGDAVAFRLQAGQRAAAAAVHEGLDTGRYAAFLLHGVTGSGKTEVYLDAAARVVDEGGGVLFLVPEIAMGTQILGRVLARFAGRAGLYHSQTGDAERRRVWDAARRGDLPVVVGTRSAVFVPIPRLRLVVIDEEHEPAYKQEEVPRYHGRDAAVMRARQADATVILGSATPSLESVLNVTREKYRLLRLEERIDQRPPARVTLVDLNEGLPPPEPGRRRPRAPRPVLSPVLAQGVQERLDRGEQTILFLNRRGHSPIVQCGNCGKAVQCPNCDVVLTWHRTDGALHCHYCGAVRREFGACDSCGTDRPFLSGLGTQKVEELLGELFPGARVARMDFDAVKRRGAHERLVREMEEGEIDILLGTQMVAKGFHFPRVTLVGVLSADQEMLQPDFRASERAFQILTQVAGRSGRGVVAGEVIYQSLMPQHPVLAAAVAGDYGAFAEREMQLRRQLGYPPFVRIIDLLVDGADVEQVRRRAAWARDLLAEQLPGARAVTIASLDEALESVARAAGLVPPGSTPAGAPARRGAVEILGPAPMPHARLKGRHRWHLTLKGQSVEKLHAAVIALLEAKPPAGLSGTRILVDVDPLGMV